MWTCTLSMSIATLSPLIILLSYYFLSSREVLNKYIIVRNTINTNNEITHSSDVQNPGLPANFNRHFAISRPPFVKIEDTSTSNDRTDCLVTVKYELRWFAISHQSCHGNTTICDSSSPRRRCPSPNTTAWKNRLTRCVQLLESVFVKILDLCMNREQCATRQQNTASL